MKCGGLAILLVLYALPNIPPPKVSSGPAYRKWLQLDYIGALLSIGMVTCLLIPLQWGGNERPWNDPTVIALLAVVCVQQLQRL